MFRTSDAAFLVTFDDQTPKTFTEAEVKAQTSEIEKKFKEERAQLLGKLQMLETTSKLTKEEREETTKTIEELRKKVFTAEELSQQEVKKQADQFKRQLENTTSERDSWRSKYSEEKITRGIMDAALHGEAFNPTQIVSLLRGDSHLEELKDDEGQVTGYEPKVRVRTLDKNKQPVELILNPQQAVEQLKQDPSFFNLFKSTMKDSMGSSNGSKGSKMTLAEAAKLSPEAYRKYVKDNPNAI